MRASAPVPEHAQPLASLDPHPQCHKHWLFQGSSLVFRPANTSMSVVLPAPEDPTRAVRMPGLKTPLQSFSRRSMVTPSIWAALGPIFSGSVVSMACMTPTLRQQCLVSCSAPAMWSWHLPHAATANCRKRGGGLPFWYESHKDKTAKISKSALSGCSKDRGSQDGHCARVIPHGHACSVEQGSGTGIRTFGMLT